MSQNPNYFQDNTPGSSSLKDQINADVDITIIIDHRTRKVASEKCPMKHILSIKSFDIKPGGHYQN